MKAAPMRVAMKTLGCRLNEAELETWAQQFQSEGHRIVQEPRDADLMILNSCAVTQDAVRKSRQAIRRLHRENPHAKLVVSGCFASLNPEEAAESLGVDLVVSNADKDRLVEMTKDRLGFRTMTAFSTEPGESALFSLGRQRAFVKVQDGCRYRCTFCIVTIARGEERSRPIGEIVAEINTLHSQGIREVILTGVHLGGYGSDLGLRLEDLISAVLRETDISRLRLGSLEPWELTDGFFEMLAHPRFMPHLHLPLQSGADSVLRRMARRCKTDEFRQLLTKARQCAPDLNVTTDIIVGFPGETECEWKTGLAFIRAMNFGGIHIFSYSPRSGTKAADLPDQVSEPTKKLRSQELQALADECRISTMKRYLGRTLEVLWEEGQHSPTNGTQRFLGYTPNYLRVEAVSAEGKELGNRILTTCLTRISATKKHLIGEVNTP